MTPRRHFVLRRSAVWMPPRRLGGVMATIGLAYLLFAPQAGAADFNVTRTDDPAPNGCVSGVDCSLREAVVAANTAGSSNRILLPAGTYTLSIAGAGEDLAATGDLDVDTGDLEVRGTGAGPDDTVIDATGLSDRIFDALPSGDMRILNLTLRGGSEVDGGAIRSVRELTLRRVTFDQNTATNNGGAIHSSEDTARVTVEDSIFSSNNANRGGAIFNTDASTLAIARATFSTNIATDFGGAIFNQEDGTVTLSDGRLENNRAEDSGSGKDGGAIFTQNSSSFTIVRSVLTGNHAEEAGGAIYAQNDSALTIIDTTLSGNMALGTGVTDGGGAIHAQNDSAVLIVRSTISGNHSNGDAGAISRNNDGQLLMRNSTVSGNSADGSGGGLILDGSGGGGFVAIESSTVTDNSAGDLGGGVYQEGDLSIEAGFRNTIIAGNTATGVANDCETDGVGTITSKGFNLDSTGSCEFDQGSDLPNTDPLLGPLADNGGPTETHRLLVGSPAIDTGTTDALGAVIDQRAVLRPQGAGRDIGAVERLGAIPSTCILAETAVEDWKSQVPTGECAELGGEEKVCKAWVKTCKKIARAAAKCRKAEVSNSATLQKAACKLPTVVDSKQCRKDVTAELKVLKADSKAQQGAADVVCEDHLDDCITLCDL